MLHPDVPSQSPPVCVVVSDAEAAEALRAEWDELADRCEAGPFARPLFALTWWRHLGQGSLQLVTVRIDGRLVALAPLHARRIGPVQVVRWLGHGLGTVAEALVDPDHEAAGEALWGEVAGHTRVLDLIECRDTGHLPDEDTLPDSHLLRLEPRDSCPVIDVRGDAETHLAEPAAKRVRRTVRVARRRLEQAGHDLDVRAATDPASLARLLPAIQAVFDAAEAHHPRQHLLAGEWADFTTAILQEGVSARDVLVLVAFIDDSPVAFDIILLTPTTMSSWIGRYDPAVKHYSPGHLVQCAGLDWAAEHGYEVIDLLLGDSYYKQLWANRSYDTLGLESGRPGIVRALQGVVRLKERLRDR